MFPEGPVELYTVFLVFSSPPNLVKNLAKTLAKNLAQNLIKNLAKNLANNLVKNLAKILRKIKTLVPKNAISYRMSPPYVLIQPCEKVQCSPTLPLKGL